MKKLLIALRRVLGVRSKPLALLAEVARMRRNIGRGVAKPELRFSQRELSRPWVSEYQQRKEAK